MRTAITVIAVFSIAGLADAGKMDFGKASGLVKSLLAG